ncbi:MAG: HAD family hydrolase [Aquabacterium sp.]
MPAAGVMPRAVLFDLDGTLIDSAADLAHATNVLRHERGLVPMLAADLRALTGSGARGMLRGAFGLQPGAAAYAELREAFVRRYSDCLLRSTTLFDGMDTVLSRLADSGSRWGIVTNKSTALTRPILDGLGLSGRAGAVVCGDTTPHLKPHPAPLLEAAARIGVAPAHCVYVGDDPRDMLAGRAAGMRTLAAAWGYLGTATPLHEWDADDVAHRPGDLLKLLQLA